MYVCVILSACQESLSNQGRDTDRQTVFRQTDWESRGAERERREGWSYLEGAWPSSCHSLAVAMASGRSRTAGHPMGADAACVTMVTGLCPGRL